MSLPTAITEDLFNIEFKTSRIALDHLADVVDENGFRVIKIDDYDIKVWFSFESESINGDLIVDRIKKEFHINASNGKATKSKDFAAIEKFLMSLRKEI